MRAALKAVAVAVALSAAALTFTGCAPQTTEQKVEALVREQFARQGDDLEVRQAVVDEEVDQIIETVEESCDLDKGLLDIVLDNQDPSTGATRAEFKDLYFDIRELVCE